VRSTFTTRTVRAASVTAAFALLMIGAAPAAAAETPWYLSALKIDAGAAQGLTGDGLTIAVLDGPINPDIPTLADADITVHEPSFCYDEDNEPVPATSTETSAAVPTEHGTNVVSMIVGSGEGYGGVPGVVGVAPGATVNYYAVYTAIDEESGETSCLEKDSGIDVGVEWGDALNAAIDDGADIVSVSLSTGAGDVAKLALARAFREGVIVIGSLQNSSVLTFNGGMPAFANGALGVQAAGEDGAIQTTDGVPNRSYDVDIVAPGLGITVQGDPSTGNWEDQFLASGTSLAAPLTAGVIALAMEKYPDATGNQMLQSLIRNTGGTPDHEPEFDPENFYGYGLVSLENLLATDPTKYDDVNPLILEVGDSFDVLIPSYDEIFNPAPVASEAPVATIDDDPATGIPVWIWLVLGGVLVVVAVVVVVIVTVVRKSAPRPTQ
jgi:hypothetical protein